MTSVPTTTEGRKMKVNKHWRKSAYEVLQAIDAGTVTLVCVGKETPQEVYAGNVEYKASNGWTIVVFNDCNEWDYLDEISDPLGTSLDYDGINEVTDDLRNYGPSEEVAWLRYGIPGYLDFRKDQNNFPTTERGTL